MNKKDNLCCLLCQEDVQCTGGDITKMRKHMTKKHEVAEQKLDLLLHVCLLNQSEHGHLVRLLGPRLVVFIETGLVQNMTSLWKIVKKDESFGSDSSNLSDNTLDETIFYSFSETTDITIDETETEKEKEFETELEETKFEMYDLIKLRRKSRDNHKEEKTISEEIGNKSKNSKVENRTFEVDKGEPMIKSGQATRTEGAHDTKDHDDSLTEFAGTPQEPAKKRKRTDFRSQRSRQRCETTERSQERESAQSKQEIEAKKNPMEIDFSDKLEFEMLPAKDDERPASENLENSLLPDSALKDPVSDMSWLVKLPQGDICGERKKTATAELNRTYERMKTAKEVELNITYESENLTQDLSDQSWLVSAEEVIDCDVRTNSELEKTFDVTKAENINTSMDATENSLDMSHNVREYKAHPTRISGFEDLSDQTFELKEEMNLNTSIDNEDDTGNPPNQMMSFSNMSGMNDVLDDSFDVPEGVQMNSTLETSTSSSTKL